MQRLSLRLVLSAALMLAAACASSDDGADAAGDGASAAAVATADAPAGGGGLPTGRYQCMDGYTEIGADTRITYKEVLLVEDDDTYRFREDGPTGEYAYDEATGEIRWLSGPYAGGNPTGSFRRRDDGREVIVLSYTFEELGSDDDFCVRRTDA